MTLTPTASTGLAIDGADPVRREALPTWPQFGTAEVEATADVLRSGLVNYWTGGHGRAFEREFAAWAEVGHAVAVANGTIALEIALRALGVGPGSEVVVPAATFIATASAVVAAGARPVVVDVDADSQALTVETVAPALTPRTAAVIAVHVGGYPADTASLAELAGARGLTLLEDCAQAHGARRGGRPVGTRGRVATWSFCQDKIMSTGGEGGAVSTDDAEVARCCWELKDHGKSYPAAQATGQPPGFRWLHDTFGTNGRLTEMQAAIGRLQLGRVDDWVGRRRRHADLLRAELVDEPAVRLPPVPAGVEPAYYRFYAHVRADRLKPGWTRDRIVAAIGAEGVPCAFGGCTEIYRERAFDRVGRPARPLPVARWLGESSFVLPVHPTLSDPDMRDVAHATRKVLREATA